MYIFQIKKKSRFFPMVTKDQVHYFINFYNGYKGLRVELIFFVI